MRRLSNLRTTCAVLGIALGLSCAAAPVSAKSPAYDLIVRGGAIYDGTGAAPIMGDVAVRGDRIVAMAPHIKGKARRTIDAVTFRRLRRVFALMDADASGRPEVDVHGPRADEGVQGHEDAVQNRTGPSTGRAE